MSLYSIKHGENASSLANLLIGNIKGRDPAIRFGTG